MLPALLGQRLAFANMVNGQFGGVDSRKPHHHFMVGFGIYTRSIAFDCVQNHSGTGPGKRLFPLNFFSHFLSALGQMAPSIGVAQKKIKPTAHNQSDDTQPNVSQCFEHRIGLNPTPRR
jgi:hypothetical protein